MELIITELDSKRIKAVSSPTGKVFSDLTLKKYSTYIGKKSTVPYLHAVDDSYEPPLAQERTVFTRYEVLKALRQLPDLYARLVQVYQDNIEINLYWNSVNDIDINNEDCKAICQQLGITDEIIQQLIGIITG